LFILLVALPSNLTLIFPAPVAAASDTGKFEADGTLADPLLVASGAGFTDANSSAGSSAIQATKPTVQAVSKSGPDLSAAYRETVDLGNGEKGALISADPLKYLAADGEWKPIDPRFTQAVDGFYNLTNLMTVQTGARQALLQVSHSGLDARWTPFSLVLADGTREVALAKPRPTQAIAGMLSDDGRTVHYTGSWTMAGVDDEIVAGAGEAEHNVIFAQPPALQGERPGDDARLILRARLELPPGGQLWVNGVQQNGIFTTTETIEMRDHEGTTTLNLMPALISEKDHPAQRIIATYQMTPINLRSWEISMETPLSWWLDPVRQYPVVWDPMMQVLRAIDVAQVYQNSMCENFLAERPDAVGVGRATCRFGIVTAYGPVRTLLRFNQVDQLGLPPQAQILGGILLVAPYDGYINYTSYGEFDPCVNTRLHAITQDWNPATVNWSNQPAVGQAFLSNSTSYQGRNDPPLCFRPEPYSHNNTGTKYLLQDGPNGIVTDWIKGGLNFGLELRATEGEENNCDYHYGCDFVQMPKRSVWPRSDRDQTFFNDFEAMEGGGFMLLVRYKGPTLTNNVPFRYDSPYPIPPKFASEDFHRTQHYYTLPAPTGSPWVAVGAKGFSDQILVDGVVKEGQFSYPLWAQQAGGSVMAAAAGAAQPQATAGANAVQSAFQPAYAFPLAVATDNCTNANCEVRSEGGGNEDGSNFIMLKSNAANGRTLRVDPVAPDPALDKYAVEASWSTSLPPVAAADVISTGVKYVYTATVETGDIVKAFDLNLPANVQLRVATSVTVEGLFAPTASVVTHLFPPNKDAYGKSENHARSIGTNALLSPIPASGGGSYGLVVELPGDKTAFDYCGPNGCEGGDVDGTPADRNVTIVFSVQVCPARSIPDGEDCQLVTTPDWTTYPQTTYWRVVGPYRIFTLAGFEDGCESLSGQSCARRKDANGVAHATVITWGDQIGRALILTHDSGSSSQYLAEFRTDANAYITASVITLMGKLDGANQLAPSFYLKNGRISAGFLGDENIYSGWITGNTCTYYEQCYTLPLSDFDRANYTTRYSGDVTEPSLRIRMPQDDVNQTVTEYAEFSAKIIRPLNTVNGPQDQQLTVTWTVQAEGYRGRFESPGGTGPLTITVVPGPSVAAAPVAGLTYQYSGNWEGDYSEDDGYIDQFRNNEGRIYQSADLGGAWSYVDYVILPFGKAPGGGSGLAMCPGFCGDVRAANDTWTAPNRQWKMPDILVNQLPNTVMVSSPGSLQVYSTDHPSSPASTEQANDTYGLSFKTFGASVELTDGVCPDGSSNQPVSLIKGTTSLSLPGLDPKADPEADSSAIPSITASFVLCENALRQVNITFKYPPGIAVAAPPVLFVDMIGGTVTIGPQNVIIRVDIGFYIGTGEPRIMKGVATLTLDTRGLFDMQAQGRVMGTMDAEGHLWVAWNPLDTGIGSQGWLPNKNDWVIKGFMYAHIWRGGGWQNKYPWLAGNDDFHLTASYQATFKIAEGAAVDEWPIVIPPDDIEIGVELSFGQFCDNDACTELEWGIKGKVTIAGFDVGAFVSLECGPLLAAVVFPPAVLLCTSFILGSDDHLLIDQYGGNGPPFPLAVASADAPEPDSSGEIDDSDVGEPVRDVRLAAANRITVADPSAATVDQPLTVKASASSMMVAFGWVRGAPQFALIMPNGDAITAANAASMGATVATTANSILFGIQDPTPGKWVARVTKATITDDYRIMYFANKSTPSVVFTAPTGVVNVNAGGDSTGAQNYQVQWMPPPNANQLSMSLFYSATVANATSTGYQYGGVIRENIDPAAGSYDWDLSHLASGDYRIYATLQDKKGAQVSEFGTDQFVGVTTSIAPGTLRYLDAVGPPMPNAASITYLDVEDGVKVCWDVNPAHDLAQYYLTYRITDSGYASVRTITERVLAVVPYEAGARQCMRIGGLVSGDSTISFVSGGLAAADASGNISGYAVPPDHATQANGNTHYGPDALVLSGSASAGNANLNWADGGAITKYELFYAREALAGPQQPGTGASAGDSPISIDSLGFDGHYTVSGLPRGFWYAFAVRQYGLNSQAPPSLLSNQVWLLISSGVDSNGDGCPDDWEAAHKPYSGSSNPDGDGLTTAQECKNGTNPRSPDTDGDGTVDGVEVQKGSDPLDPASVPMLTQEEVNSGVVPPLPATLGVEESNLVFYAFSQGPNPDAQRVPFSNLGDGSFTLNLSDNQPWLSATVDGSDIVVKINKSGLAVGTYNGKVQVRADPAMTLGSPVAISVQLVVLAGDSPGAKAQLPLYLPDISR
jgi:hypothetical protein